MAGVRHRCRTGRTRRFMAIIWPASIPRVSKLSGRRAARTFAGGRRARLMTRSAPRKRDRPRTIITSGGSTLSHSSKWKRYWRSAANTPGITITPTRLRVMAEDQSREQINSSSESRAISALTADRVDHYRQWLRTEIRRKIGHQECQLRENPQTREWRWMHSNGCHNPQESPQKYQMLEWQRLTLEEMYLGARRFAQTADRQT